MSNKRVVILSEKTLQTSLMEQQLTEKLDINLEVLSASELAPSAAQQDIDLVLVDFEQLQLLVNSGTIPNFDLLKIDILIYNMPPESTQCEFIY